MNKLTWYLKKADPLVIEDIDQSIEKDKNLQKGIQAIQGMSFRSSLLSFNQLSKGNFQTCFVAVKNYYRSKFQKDFEYDRREEFTFKDGGKIYLDFKGQGFDLDNKPKTYKPVVFFCIGLASHSKTGNILDIVEHLIKGDGYDPNTSFDVVVINWRGLGGMKLQTPVFYCASSAGDLLEPIEYVYNKFCKPFNRKTFALGCSMGGNVLINSLGVRGNQSFIDAACVISVPMKMWEVEDHMETACNGLYNKSFGNTLRKIIIENKDILRQNEKMNQQELDILEKQKESTFKQVDDKIIGPLFGYKDGKQMHYESSCYLSIPKLKVPTLFISSNDDPVIGSKATDHDIFKNNKFAVLATTKTGGHLGFHESIFKQQLWISDPIIKYFNAFK